MNILHEVVIIETIVVLLKNRVIKNIILVDKENQAEMVNLDEMVNQANQENQENQAEMVSMENVENAENAENAEKMVCMVLMVLMVNQA
jgi:hypothetical protein